MKESILWLPADNSNAIKNLIKQATANRISPSRLIFSPRSDSYEEYLNKYQLADLFLDTFPYNGHTTVSDALWSGLPVLTLCGKSYASRVATSILKNLNMPELTTNSKYEYKSSAIELAKNENQLSILKEKLNENKLSSSVFDSTFFTKKIESAYKVAFLNYLNNLPHNHIKIN